MVQEYSLMGVENSILDVLHFFHSFKLRQVLRTLSGFDRTGPDSVHQAADWQRQVWNAQCRMR